MRCYDTPNLKSLLYFEFFITFSVNSSSSLSDISMWDTTPLRKAIPSVDSPEPNKHTHRKTAQNIHKANTIGIPSEGELSEGSDSRVSHRPRRNIFGGLKNTLRHKHKSDTVMLEASKEGDKNDLHRRWSENTQPTVNMHVSAPLQI